MLGSTSLTSPRGSPAFSLSVARSVPRACHDIVHADCRWETLLAQAIVEEPVPEEKNQLAGSASRDYRLLAGPESGYRQ